MTASASTSETANTFTRERAPLCRETWLGATRKAFASARRASSVAAPSTGAAFTLRRSSPSAVSSRAVTGAAPAG